MEMQRKHCGIRGPLLELRSTSQEPALLFAILPVSHSNLPIYPFHSRTGWGFFLNNQVPEMLMYPLHTRNMCKKQGLPKDPVSALETHNTKKKLAAETMRFALP